MIARRKLKAGAAVVSTRGWAGVRAGHRAWRRIPRAGRACFVIAFVNVAIWSVIVPPFMVPDETSHFGYAQYLAETGQPPPQTPNASQYSPQGIVAALAGALVGAR